MHGLQKLSNSSWEAASLQTNAEELCDRRKRYESKSMYKKRGAVSVYSYVQDTLAQSVDSQFFILRYKIDSQ
mgnify:CR=1 FL=1